MSCFEVIAPQEMDPIFDRIGKDWMLITAGQGEEINTMTASWGCCGVLWNRPVAVCFVRPQRHTYQFTEREERLTLSFFEGEAYREALRLCGRKSGRDCDKFREAGLTPGYTEAGVPYPEEAAMVLVCRKLYADDLKKGCFLETELLSHYPIDDFHRVYVCEIEQVLVRRADGNRKNIY